MAILNKFNPIARAVGVMGVTAGLVTGVTFAALNDTATLQGTTLSAGDASLLIWNGNTFAETAPGFTVDDLVPGEDSDFYDFYLQNQSDGDLYVYAHVPNAPAEPQGGYGFTGWENLKVTFVSDEIGCDNDTVETDMAELMAKNVEMPCNTLKEDATGNNQEGQEGTEGNYRVSFSIDSDSVSENADDIGVGTFDLQFIGSLVEQTTPPVEEGGAGA